MLKFGRNFKAIFTIGHRDTNDFQKMIDDEVITVAFPFSCNFQIDTGIYSTSNSGQFQFYNLSKPIQQKIWLDLYESGKKYVKIDFYAGYNNTMPLIFSGYVLECTSTRESGSPDWVTNVSAFNAGDFFKYGFINATFTQGTTLADIVRMATSGTEVTPGYLTDEIKPIKRDETFIGQTMDLLTRKFAGYNVYINNNELNIIGENDVVPGDVEVITDETGLLGSPRRANLFLEIDVLFSPQLRVGQAISLLSESMPEFNRAYQIVNIKHQGIISPTVSGKTISKITLSQFASDLSKIKEVKKVQETTYQAPAKNPQWQKPVQYTRVSDKYGWRIHPIKKTKIFHHGIDLAAPKNTPVYAATDGKVIFSGWNGGYGKYIKLDHGKVNNVVLTSGYGHLNEILVSNGTSVTKGQIIGRVGSTGLSTGPHLHFEIKENNNSVNPNKYINI